ncbi:hypothetical protein HNV12_03875 [Methanococcoides sp. SA1]|nr:hypothetical protein [Methanococcoides sp. SA1]
MVDVFMGSGNHFSKREKLSELTDKDRVYVGRNYLEMESGFRIPNLSRMEGFSLPPHNSYTWTHNGWDIRIPNNPTMGKHDIAPDVIRNHLERCLK